MHWVRSEVPSRQEGALGFPFPRVFGRAELSHVEAGAPVGPLSVFWCWGDRGSSKGIIQLPRDGWTWKQLSYGVHLPTGKMRRWNEKSCICTSGFLTVQEVLQGKQNQTASLGIFIKAKSLSSLGIGKWEQIKGKATLVFFLFNVVLNHVMLKFNSSKNN